MIRVLPAPTCYLCGSRGKPLYNAMTDRLFGAPGEWNLSRCPNTDCGLIWLDPMPLEADIGQAYLTYYTHERWINSPIENVLVWCLYAPLGLLRERHRMDVMWLDRLPPGRLLDVGCGDGRRLELLSGMGWEPDGQEVDPAAIRQVRNRGLTVHEGRLGDCQLPAATYDAVISSHVIEHVHDPLELMGEMYRLLKPGGILVLATPNTESYGHLVFQENWLPLDPPRHLHLFSPRNMKTLIDRSGFKDQQVWTTMARAGTVFRGSHDIRLMKHHAMTAQPTLRSAVAELGTMIRARLEQFRRLDSGEELVGLAYK